MLGDGRGPQPPRNYMTAIKPPKAGSTARKGQDESGRQLMSDKEADGHHHFCEEAQSKGFHSHEKKGRTQEAHILMF